MFVFRVLGLLGWFRSVWDQRMEVKLHNDRDYECRYWWGDRGGYLLSQEKCPICRACESAASPGSGA